MTHPQIPWQDLPAGAAPADATPRRRRRRAVIMVAAVAAAGLAAGLVVWAPWTPPPVLRPTGLAAGPATATSITIRWSRPAKGPLPDKYLIVSNGLAAGSVAGTATSYRQAGLTPASSYLYRVVAERGGKHSPQSAALPVKTLTPPLSQARLDGAWAAYFNYSRADRRGNGAVLWIFSPACGTGACDVMVETKQGPYSFMMKLARAGAWYQGQAVVSNVRCGPAGNTIPDPVTLKIRLRVTRATGDGPVWLATSWGGTMVVSYHYVSNGAFYCSAFTRAGSLTGAPA